MPPFPLIQDASQNMKVAAVVSFYMAAALVVRSLRPLTSEPNSNRFPFDTQMVFV